MYVSVLGKLEKDKAGAQTLDSSSPNEERNKVWEIKQSANTGKRKKLQNTYDLLKEEEQRVLGPRKASVFACGPAYVSLCAHACVSLCVCEPVCVCAMSHVWRAEDSQ